MKVRLGKLDNIKGILIAFVVFGHTIEAVPIASYWQGGGFWSLLYAFIYTFHMPVFVFMSGYVSSRTKTAADAFREIFLLYLVAQLAWIWFCFLLSLVTGAERPGAATFLNVFNPGWGLWYLLSLFFWRLSVPILVKIRWPSISLIGFSALAFVIGCWDIGGWFAASRTVCFFPFFAAGFWSRQNSWRLTEGPFQLSDTVLIGSGLATAPFLATYAYRRSISLLHLSGPFAIDWREGIAFRAGLFIVAFAAIRLFWLYTPSRSTALTIVGANSISVYLMHFYLLRPLRDILPDSAWREHMWWIAPLATALCCALAPLRFAAVLDRLRKLLLTFLFIQNDDGGKTPNEAP